MTVEKRVDLVATFKFDGEKQIDKTTKSVKKMEKQTETSLAKMEKAFGKLKNAAEAAMGSMIIKAGSDAIKTSEKMGLSFEILRKKNEAVAESLEKVGDLTFGLASKYDLVDSANRALSFGIDLSNGRFEKLVSLANKTALVMGTDVKSAFDDLITGVSRESKMILDNLGVMVNLNDVYSAYAVEIGKTASELSKQERQAALLNEVNKQLEKSTAAVTDEMVKAGTRGTAALKKIETGAKDVLNTAAKLFVGFGEWLGETTAKVVVGNHDNLQEMETDWMRYYGGLNKHTNLSYTEWLKVEKKKQKAFKDSLMFQLGIAEDYARWEKEALARTWDEGDEDALLPSERFAKQQDAAFTKFWENREKKRARVKSSGKKTKAGSTSGGDLLAEAMGFPADVAAEGEKLKHQLISLQNDIDTDLNELKRRNAKQRLVIAKKTADEEEEIEKKKADRIKAQQEKHFRLMQRFGSEYLNAIVTGQAEMIPQILANQAMMFGQELFWDGLKTMWMGTAKDALFPGLGASARAVGIAEMGIGAGLMAVGGAANYALGGSTSGTGGAQAQESTKQGSGEIYLNLEVSPYSGKSQIKRELSNLGVVMR